MEPASMTAHRGRITSNVAFLLSLRYLGHRGQQTKFTAGTGYVHCTCPRRDAIMVATRLVQSRSIPSVQNNLLNSIVLRLYIIEIECQRTKRNCTKPKIIVLLVLLFLSPLDSASRTRAHCAGRRTCPPSAGSPGKNFPSARLYRHAHKCQE